MSNKPKVLSLFSGCGGMDLGFKQAGFDIVWANDFDKDSVETYKFNFGDTHIIHEDITKIKNKDLPKPGNVDVVLGGFPCQGFSIANPNRKRDGMKDERNFLFKEMIRVIKYTKPAFFIGENVKGLMNMLGGKVRELIMSDFKKIGYKVNIRLLKASNFGVPQHRERVIIIGNNLGIENPYPKITHNDKPDLFNYNVNPYIKTKDVIGYLKNVRVRDKEFKLNGSFIYNHIASNNVSDKFWGRKYKVNQHDICDYLKEWRSKSKWTTKKVDEHFGYAHTAGHWFRKDNNSGSIPNPSDWWELKRILKFDDKYDKQVTTLVEKEIKFEQSLRISNWDTPSDTITATGPEIHPNKKRRLSVRECAIIQTFPDDFVFKGSINSMYRQIGNAVPVLMAKKIGEKIIKLL